ncbi:MAG TPA: hypothetical protein VM261_29300 [Kofleriaceae bacterium]|nr:hypothetical protein [Kofleriaceae bacterium]
MKLACVLLMAMAGTASADVFSVRAEAHGGGAGGLGVGGDAKDQAFQNIARGGAYGALVGAEVLFVDAWVQHHQYNDGELLGTWTQFMAGLDLDIGIGGGEPIRGAKDGAKTKAKGYIELGLGVGFGVGTDRQVDPPLDNSEVSDKGFLLEGRVGAGANLGSALSIGVSLPVTAGYYFVSGEDAAANDIDTQYQAIEAALLVNLRLKIKVK